MYNNDYEILNAIRNGALRNFHDDWPPENSLVNKDCFDRLLRENFIHAPIDNSTDNGWSYWDVTLNSSGILYLEKLKDEREELTFTGRLGKFFKKHVIASVSVAALFSTAVVALVQESVKLLFN
ncbi:hypothetical protein Q4524_07420 [Alteromonas stellipolaris]|uniref:hypothetical protein n=1 Tax=Alteromonas stellipolaris TaxID=233316 RepID=UPI0026E3C6F7|nr:hypothetical protein [Alteromonas stellipolaris]MDO6538409.1 hypothetical protein [Alteromonas stellipolaris]